MVKRLTVIFVVCLFVMSIFAWGALAATAEKKSSVKHPDATWTRHISEDINIDAPGYELYLQPSTAKGIYKYLPMGMKDLVTCDSIHPECGDTCPVVQHDSIGFTWYEYQHNASIGRMISVTDAGYRHFSWMFTDCNYLQGPPCFRYVDYVCKNPSNQYTVQDHADGGANENAGYSNQAHLNDGLAVTIHHRTWDTPTGTCWWTVLSIQEAVCTGNFTRDFDVPDSIVGAPSNNNGMWPHGEVSYDEGNDSNYIHLAITEGETEAGVNLLAYERCRIKPTTSNTMICESFVDGSPHSWTIQANTHYSSHPYPHWIGHFDSSCSVSPVVATSPVSKKVAIAYLKPAVFDDCDYLEDAAYIECTDNGNTWLNGSYTRNRITAWGTDGDERNFHDLAACYDYQDTLHVVYVTAGFPEPGYYQPGIARLYHWTERDGLGAGGELIATGIWGGSDAGAHNCNIAKPSISAVEEYDSVLLYCTWVQFDSADWNAAETYTNGDVYGIGSSNGGYTWGATYNLTNTKTPGCAPGECVSEHFASLAKSTRDYEENEGFLGDLHIQYICDKDPGAAIMDESEWMANPVYYLHMEAWPIITVPVLAYFLDDPEQPEWFHPPLKVEPNTDRDLQIRFKNIGGEALTYTASSDDPTCLEGTAGGTLPPRAEATHIFTLKGTACNDEFIDANIVVNTNEPGKKQHKIPVQAIVSDDYYECPRDPETEDSLENGVLRLYVNANSQEWVEDMTIADEDLIAVFFQGGLFVATTADDDTLVGRYMGDNDQYALAQDKLHLEDYDDYWVLHNEGTIIHDLAPPEHDYKWYGYVMNKAIFFFKPTASDDLKRCVIKWMCVEPTDPPSWWPEQPPIAPYDAAYIGLAMDFDAPWDTSGDETGDENGVNFGRYDDVNHIAYQKGFGREHPDYANYCTGAALANGGGGPSGEQEAYKSHCCLNNVYLYPQSPWGWNHGELYQLASDISGGRHVIDHGPPSPDSIVDRTIVFTAQMIPEGKQEAASFTLIEVAAPNGEAQMETYVAAARSWVDEHKVECGDVNKLGGVGDLGDIVYLISYVFRSGPPPEPPLCRANVNSSGGVGDLGDIVYLISYVFRSGPPPDCPACCPSVW